jgi:hypothetical protein
MLKLGNVTKLVLCAALVLAAVYPAQAQDRNQARGTLDLASVSVGRSRPMGEGMSGGFGTPHPYHIEARHWEPGVCDEAKAAYDLDGTLPIEVKEFEAKRAALLRTIASSDVPTDFSAATPEEIGASIMAADRYGSLCGNKFYEYDGENLVTSVGETLFSDLMAKLTSPPAQCNYIALTNTGITPAVGDTTLSGEIAVNGLSRAQATYADASAAIGALSAGATPTTVGTAGAATLDYWPVCHTYQGYTGVPATGAQLTTANATLSNANYVIGTFTGKLGCTDYVVVRTNSGTQPSGSLTGGAAQTNSGIIGGYISCSNNGLVAGTAPTCTFVDQSNTTSAFTIPGSDQTFAGKFTLTKTFTATGTQSAQAFGIFNASSVGTMCLEGTFTSASLVTNDTLAFTETVYHALRAAIVKRGRIYMELYKKPELIN